MTDVAMQRTATRRTLGCLRSVALAPCSTISRPTGTDAPAVVLRMRGRSTLGATFFAVLADYARQLDDVGGRLYVSGLDPALMAQAERTGSIAEDGPVRLYEASPLVGDSSLQAFHDAQAWIAADEAGELDS